MARSKENLAFADRLKQALARAPKRIETPSELALQFNLSHPGAQITNQAAQKWLVGDNKPTLEKMETLAGMCRVSVQWLRYGIPETGPLQNANLQRAKPETPAPTEGNLVLNFRQLSEFQQNLIVNLVEQMVLSQRMWINTAPPDND